MDQDTRDGLLLAIHSEVRELRTVVSDVREKQAAIATRQEDHTGRIHLIETKQGEHGKVLGEHGASRSRLTGVWVGAAALLALVASMAGLLKILLGK
jgi:hypothetical protein